MLTSEEERLRHEAELEEMGEAKVRKAAATRLYTGRHGGWTEEWLAARDQAQVTSDAAVARASQSEQIDIARSAKDAAWAAARAAKNANMIATLALIAAAIAMAISVVTLFVHSASAS